MLKLSLPPSLNPRAGTHLDIAPDVGSHRIDLESKRFGGLRQALIQSTKRRAMIGCNGDMESIAGLESQLELVGQTRGGLK